MTFAYPRKGKKYDFILPRCESVLFGPAVKTTRPRAPKPSSMRAVKKTISLPAYLFELAEQRTHITGFATFSDFVQSALREKLAPHAARPVA